MGYFLLVVVVILVIIIVWGNSINQKELAKPYTIVLKHINGHPKISANEIISLKIDNNDVIFLKDKIEIDRISINNLIKYEVKTEDQIQKDVTLTRLLTLGIFAFALPKKRTVENKYLILSYVVNGVEINSLF
jgi:hypothetical protein